MGKYRKNQVFHEGSTRWVHVGTLGFDVKRAGKVVLPAGTRGVDIAFRSGPFEITTDGGSRQRVNLYRCRGKIY